MKKYSMLKIKLLFVTSFILFILSNYIVLFVVIFKKCLFNTFNSSSLKENKQSLYERFVSKYLNIYQLKKIKERFERFSLRLKKKKVK